MKSKIEWVKKEGCYYPVTKYINKKIDYIISEVKEDKFLKPPKSRIEWYRTVDGEVFPRRCINDIIINDENPREFSYPSLSTFLDIDVENELLRKSNIHRMIQKILFSIGLESGYVPVMEAGYDNIKMYSENDYDISGIIDVIWFNKSAYPEYIFEIENNVKYYNHGNYLQRRRTNRKKEYSEAAEMKELWLGVYWKKKLKLFELFSNFDSEEILNRVTYELQEILKNDGFSGRF